MTGHGTGLLLLTAVAGYWVLERAAYQKKPDLRRTGKLLGWLIIVVSIVGVACNVYCLATWKGGYCPLSIKGASRHLHHAEPSIPIEKVR